MDVLKTESYLGIDSEWKPAFTKFDNIRPGIL